jgi:hypothetical protein
VLTFCTVVSCIFNRQDVIEASPHHSHRKRGRWCGSCGLQYGAEQVIRQPSIAIPQQHYMPSHVATQTQASLQPLPFASPSLLSRTRLKSGVEIWLNGSAESPLLYDKTWGGIVMCGCDFDDKLGICRNKYPDCPALTGTVIARTDCANRAYAPQRKFVSTRCLLWSFSTRLSVRSAEL